MKILKSWLNDWIDIENISSDDISEALESLGFEIETKVEKTPNYKNIIVGKKTIKPRMTKVPTIIPLPKKKHYVSIYELQK